MDNLIASRADSTLETFEEFRGRLYCLLVSALHRMTDENERDPIAYTLLCVMEGMLESDPHTDLIKRNLKDIKKSAAPPA